MKTYFLTLSLFLSFIVVGIQQRQINFQARTIYILKCDSVQARYVIDSLFYDIDIHYNNFKAIEAKYVLAWDSLQNEDYVIRTYLNGESFGGI